MVGGQATTNGTRSCCRYQVTTRGRVPVLHHPRTRARAPSLRRGSTGQKVRRRYSVGFPVVGASGGGSFFGVWGNLQVRGPTSPKGVQTRGMVNREGVI